MKNGKRQITKGEKQKAKENEIKERRGGVKANIEKGWEQKRKGKESKKGER